MKTEIKYGREYRFDNGRVLVRNYCLEPNALDDRFESQFPRHEIYIDGVLEYVGPRTIQSIKDARVQLKAMH